MVENRHPSRWDDGGRKDANKSETRITRAAVNRLEKKSTKNTPVNVYRDAAIFRQHNNALVPWLRSAVQKTISSFFSKRRHV